MRCPLTVWTALFCAACPLLAGCSSRGASAGDWAESFPDPSGAASALMAVAPSGAVALAGTFGGQITLGHVEIVGVQDSETVFVSMLDASGQVAWAVAGGSSGGQVAEGVAFEPGGDVVVAGDFSALVDFGTGPLTALSDDIFVARFGPGGHPVWVQQFNADDGGPTGAGDSTVGALAVDTTGNIAVGGAFSGTLGFGGPPIFAPAGSPESGFVAVLDPAGRFLSNEAFGGTANNVTAVAFDAAGNLYVGGVDRGSLTLGASSFTSSGSNGYLAKLTPHGEVTWALQLQGEGSSEVLTLAVDAGGDVIAGGNFAGELVAGELPPSSTPNGGAFLLRVSAGGAPQWLTLLDDNQLGAITASPGGGVLVTGTAGAITLIPPVAFAAAYDDQGAQVQTLAIGTTPDVDRGVPYVASSGTGIGVAGDSAVVCGSFAAPLLITSTLLQPVGPGDLFAARQAM